MKKILYKILRKIYHLCIGCVWLIKLPFCHSYYDAESYFPEYSNRRKSKLRIFFDQVKNILKYSTPNKFYFLYGLDIKGFHDENDFVDNVVFMTRRGAMNHRTLEFPPISILRDKALFGIVADAYGINTPTNIGIIFENTIYLFRDKKTITLPEFIVDYTSSRSKRDFFVKKIDGECADGVFHITLGEGVFLYKNKPIDCNVFFEKNHKYLLQEAISNQHSALSAIHAKAINTLRLVTVNDFKNNRIEVFSCVLRVGKGQNQVDNWAAGGLSVGVDTDKGVLRKYGFYKPSFGTKATEHPDSHTVFEDYTIPFIKEAIEQAKIFHYHLTGIHSIGWDIAITDDGPCFVEGNDNWEISLMQISNHGLKKEFDNLFY